MSTRNSMDDRQRRVADALKVGNPGAPGGNLLPLEDDDGLERQLELSIDAVRDYEHNPRRSRNAKFEDIKESIRTSGLRSPLAVTRRPGEAGFIVEAGGNSRLRALRELWAETRDPRFSKVVVLFRPWCSESHVLTAHLIENELRGEMSFWDRASGIVALKQRLEVEQGRRHSLRTLEDSLHGVGLSVNTATLALYLYAHERLRTLGDAVESLSGLDVKTLQPRLNALRRVALAHSGIDEEKLFSSVFEPVFKAVAEAHVRGAAFSVSDTVLRCELALSGAIGIPVDALRISSGQTPRQARAGVNDPGSCESSVPVRDAAPTERPETEALVEQMFSFAELAGIRPLVVADPTAVAGCRLEGLPEGAQQDPAAWRAWTLLSVVTGAQAPNACASATPEADFVRWLMDSSDPSAEAFWRLLEGLRRSGGSSPSACLAGGLRC